MAVYREAPKCPYCGKVIAKGIYKKENPFNPVYGDSFLRWEYKKHWCIKGVIAKRKQAKELLKLMKENDIDINFYKTKKQQTAMKKRNNENN